MSMMRKMYRRNNMVGLKTQIEEKTNENFALQQKLQMGEMYYTEISKISNGLKEIIMDKLGVTEEEVMTMLDEQLNVEEAKDVQELMDKDITDPEVFEEGDAIESLEKEEVQVDAIPDPEVFEEDYIPEVIEIVDEAVIEETIADIESSAKKAKAKKVKAKKKVDEATDPA